MYMYGQAPLLFTQKYHNIVNRLLPQYNIKSLKFEKQGKKIQQVKKKKYHFCKIHRICQRTCLIHLASIISLAPTKEQEGKVQLTSSNLALTWSTFQEAPKHI